MPGVGARTAFVRMAAVHDDRGVFQAFVKKLLIGRDDKDRRNLPAGVSEHAIIGNDSKTLDTGRARHS